MCGRYASARKRQDLLEEFRIDRDRVADDLEPDYNVAPTKRVYAVLSRGERGTAAPSGQDGRSGPDPASDVARELRVVRWGLVPFWAKDPAIGSRLINARAETVDSKPSFRSAFAKRRCLLPADGFYEWLKVEQDGKTRKQPYYIHRADGRELAFAGLYELWRDPSVPEDQDNAWLWTTTIITTTATDEVGQIHDRMPMVIEPAAWPDWLDPDNTEAAGLQQLLVPAVSGGLTSYPVSTAVNNVRNNGPELAEAVPGPPSLPQPRSGPSGSDQPDGAATGSGGTLF
jgi:putative SOS response-associated peptidase YedK